MKLPFFFLFIGNLVFSQYQFSGTIDVKKWQPTLYLSKVEDYRKCNGVFADQIIAITQADENGNFVFKGKNLTQENAILRIHVDNCKSDTKSANHYNGHCENYHQVLFIAHNKDTINFPISSFENQMFCEMTATNPKSNVFLRIDSLEQTFDIITDLNNKNHDLYAKKWYNEYMLFAQKINEPLAELYIYSKISDKTSDLYSVYLNDLSQNNYFTELKGRLQKQNPNSKFNSQFDIDLQSDLYTASLKHQNKSWIKWIYTLAILLFVCLLCSLIFIFKYKKLQKKLKETKQNDKEKLSQQELKILYLIKQNKTNKEISEELFISLSTVKTHINNIYKKLNISNRNDVLNL